MVTINVNSESGYMEIHMGYIEYKGRYGMIR
jgi:hypothetical protein